MMHACFIFHTSNGSSPYKIRLIQQFLNRYNVHLTFNLIKEPLVVYIWQQDRFVVWQEVLNFEVAQVIVGYGFGRDIVTAYRQASERLDDIVIALTETRFR